MTRLKYSESATTFTSHGRFNARGGGQSIKPRSIHPEPGGDSRRGRVVNPQARLP